MNKSTFLLFYISQLKITQLWSTIQVTSNDVEVKVFSVHFNESYLEGFVDFGDFGWMLCGKTQFRDIFFELLKTQLVETFNVNCFSLHRDFVNCERIEYHL